MKVEVYGAEWCHVCKQAVQLCEKNNISCNYIDVDVNENLAGLEERAGGKIKSLPQIYLNGNLIPNGYIGLRQELVKI